MPLYSWDWELPNPRGVIALIHGAGEHCGRYQRAAKRFNACGYAVHGVDLPGHGQSPGIRGHVDSFDEYLQAVDELLDQLHTSYPHVPLHLFGHSMGGLIAIRFIQTRGTPHVRSVVVSSPCLALTLPTPKTKIKIATWIEKVWPTFHSSSGILPEYLSRSPSVVQAASTDPYMVSQVSIRWYLQLEAAMKAVQTSTRVFSVPILFLQAGTDRLVSAPVTKTFAESVLSPNTRYVEYPQLYHELLNEPEWEQVFADMMDWWQPLESAPS